MKHNHFSPTSACFTNSTIKRSQKSPRLIAGGSRTLISSIGSSSHPFTLGHTRLFVIFILVCLSQSFSSFAQVTDCNGTPIDLSTCTAPVQNPAQHFVCIDAVSHPDIMYWIFQPAGLGMKSFAESATQPQFLYIQGYLEIEPSGLGTNYSFFGSEIIFADNTSGIKVKTGAKLTINSSYLHGCNNMWDYLRAEYLASIEVRNNSTVEDGRYAIWGYENQSIVRVVNSTFKRNAFSIVMTSDPFSNGAPIAVFSDGISGNIFEGSNQLLNNVWLYTSPIAGVFSKKLLNPIKIGQNPSSPNQIVGSNQFKEFDGFNSVGVTAQNVNLTVENSKFVRTQPTSASTSGIYSESTSSSHTTTVFGLPDLDGNGPNQPDFTFERLGFGVTGNRVNMNVQNARFNLNNSCIVHQHGDLKPISCKVNSCEMKDYKNVGLVVASDNTANVLLQNSLQVIGNTFQDGLINTPSITTYGGKRFGVRLEAFSPISMKGAWIWDNEYFNNPKAGEAYLKGGVLIKNVSKVTIEANDLTDSDGQFNPGSEFSGILLEDCSNTKLFGNVIEGINPDFYVSAGIQNIDSDNSLYNCNSVNLVKKGIEFVGASPNTKMVQNQFHQHEFGGLYSTSDFNSPMGAGAIIGDIIRGENQWNGINAFSEAAMEWVPSPQNLGDYSAANQFQWPLVAARGVFKINSPGDQDPNDTYWASPRVIGNEEDFNNKWFQKIDNEHPSGISHCVANGFTPGGGGTSLEPYGGAAFLSQSDLMILQGLYPTNTGDGWAWDAKFRFYGKLKDAPDLRPAGSAASIWYEDQQLNATGKLYDAFDALRTLSELDSTQQAALDAAYAELDTAIQEANEIATQLHQAYTAGNSTTINALHAQRLSNTNLVVALTAVYENQLNTVRAGILQQAGILLSDMNGITPTAVYETNMKTVLRTQLEMILAESGMTQAQRNTFESIATQCRYDAGWGVVMARLMLTENNYDDGVLCGIGALVQDSVARTAEANIIVSPNPTRDLLNLHIEQPFKEGLGSVYDARGHLLRTISFSKEVPQIRDLNLPSGIYFLSVTLDGKHMPMCKFVVTP